MSVRRTQEEISSREFIEWLAYDSIDPGEPVRSDMNAAMISSIIANVNRDPKKRARPYEPKDFMWDFEGRTRKAPAKEIKMKLELWRQSYQHALEKKKLREAKIQSKQKKVKR